MLASHAHTQHALLVMMPREEGRPKAIIIMAEGGLNHRDCYGLHAANRVTSLISARASSHITTTRQTAEQTDRQTKYTREKHH